MHKIFVFYLKTNFSKFLLKILYEKLHASLSCLFGALIALYLTIKKGFYSYKQYKQYAINIWRAVIYLLTFSLLETSQISCPLGQTLRHPWKCLLLAVKIILKKSWIESTSPHHTIKTKVKNKDIYFGKLLIENNTPP